MSDLPPWSDRIIIALDLDAFYVSASRKRDPSLNGLPVGIKQKNLFATISYEARKYGVEKLSSIRDGMAKCPEMLIVNGEDLSYFRKISMQVFKLVSSMVWHGKVEKLGMDELFCDCTDMIEAQMVEMEQSQDLQKFPGPVGFVLPLDTDKEIQHRLHQIHRFQRQTRKLFLATHLALEIRNRVAEEIGLTSSAGIATSKLVAKMVGNTHKPNCQTLFASLSQEQSLLDIRTFLDPYSLRSLNGFGSVIVNKMCTFVCKALGQDEKEFSSSQLTVSLARQIFDLQSLSELFGSRLGLRLHNLIQGQDDEPVIKAPEYPAQISIEDTYRSHQAPQGEALLEQIFILSQSLLRRLETELLDQNESSGNRSIAAAPKYEYQEKPVIVDQGIVTGFKVRDYSEKDEEADNNSRLTWKRYPLSVRLSIRQNWENRVSRQGKMPVEIFDLFLSRKERAKILAQNVEAILKALFASEGDKGKGLNLINIAALDLSPHRPAQSIGGFFRSGSRVKDESTPSTSDWQREAIDLAFLRELPTELRKEIAKEYNITLDDEEVDVDDNIVDGERIHCQDCGQLQSIWLQHDHSRWLATGLPPSHNDAVDWLLESDEDER